MDIGCYNGTSGSCPSGYNPYDKTRWVWVTYDTLNNTNYENLIIDYSYQNPKYYLITSLSDKTKMLVIENRLREGFDLYTPNDPSYITPDTNDIYNGNQGGLLIWFIYQNGAYVKMKHASNIELSDFYYADHPFPYRRGDY